MKIGNVYGHDIEEAKTWESARYDGVVIQDGVRGGGDGAIRRYNNMSSTNDKYIIDLLSVSRWLNLKQLFKLNKNNVSPKHGQPGYTTIYKYAMIYHTMVDNAIVLTIHTDMDLTGDATSWAHQGDGESISNSIK